MSVRRLRRPWLLVVLAALLPGCAKDSVTNVPLDVAAVILTGGRASLVVGETMQLNATPRSASGRDLTARPVSWGTSNSAVAQVSPSGLVTGTGAGSARITATAGGIEQGLDVTVVQPPRIGLSTQVVQLNGVQALTAPTPVQVAITNTGGGSLTGLTTSVAYQGSASGWLQATLSGAAAPATLTLTPSIQGLAAGTYTATVAVAASGADNSPQTIAVTMVLAPSFVLTVGGGGTGSGAVTGGGINCTITAGTASGTCTQRYPSGTAVTLTAAPTGGAQFQGWSGGCTASGANCTATMTADRNVTAAFGLPPVQLTVTGAGNGSGTVRSTPAGIDCSIAAGTATGSCQANFAAGSSVTLTATPATGSNFTGWGGACSGSAGCTVTMSAARTVTASFAAATPVVTTTDADNITSTTARLTGTIAQDGMPYQVWFEWGTSPTLATFDQSGIGNGPPPGCPGVTDCFWTFTAPDLSSGTTYYFRLVGQNAAGVTRGSIRSFTTAGAPTIAGITHRVVSVNTCTNQNPPGTLFEIEFTYSDPDGNVTADGTPITVNWSFNNGSSGTFQPTSFSRTGNGFTGSFVVSVCGLYGSATSATWTMILRDADGFASNALSVTIPKPAGANSEITQPVGAGGTAGTAGNPRGGG